MELRITVRGLNEAAPLREHAEERIIHALQRFERRIRRVGALLEDVTGPAKQTIDKRCRLTVRLKPHGELMIDELGADIHAVLDVALDRLKAALSRRTARVKRGIGGG